MAQPLTETQVQRVVDAVAKAIASIDRTVEALKHTPVRSNWPNPLPNAAVPLTEASLELTKLRERQEDIIARLLEKENELAEKERKLDERDHAQSSRDGGLDERENFLKEQATELKAQAAQIISDRSELRSDIRVHDQNVGALRQEKTDFESKRAQWKTKRLGHVNELDEKERALQESGALLTSKEDSLAARSRLVDNNAQEATRTLLGLEKREEQLVLRETADTKRIVSALTTVRPPLERLASKAVDFGELHQNLHTLLDRSNDKAQAVERKLNTLEAAAAGKLSHVFEMVGELSKSLQGLQLDMQSEEIREQAQAQESRAPSAERHSQAQAQAQAQAQSLEQQQKSD